MGIPTQIEVSGTATSAPTPSRPGSPSLRGFIDISMSQGYGAQKCSQVDVNDLVTAPLIIPFESITKVHFLALRARGNVGILLSSDTGGADQRISNAGLIVLHIPPEPDAFTAIKLFGVGDVEYLIAGN